MRRNLEQPILLIALVLVLVKTTPLLADTITLNFEGLGDLDSVTNQFGLMFAKTVVLTPVISLNEIDFTPHSGVNVVSDDGGFAEGAGVPETHWMPSGQDAPKLGRNKGSFPFRTIAALEWGTEPLE